MRVQEKLNMSIPTGKIKQKNNHILKAVFGKDGEGGGHHPVAFQ